MQNIAIQNIPNQSFNVILDDNQWDITIKSVNGCLAVSLILNGAVLLKNILVAAYQPIIPSEYSESGNFTFITLNQEVVDYEKFGISQNLIYFSADELAAARSDPAIGVTDDDFNPLGGFPLRYKPKGYVLAP